MVKRGHTYMKDLLKNITVVILCVFLVLTALVYTGSIPMNSLPFVHSKDDDPTITAIGSQPQAPIIEEQDMPSAVDATTPPPQQSATIKAPAPEVEGSIYQLKSPTSSSIGDAGLLPATPVAVVKKRTKTTVSFDACTVAFSLPSKNHKYSYAITAGHCGKPGQSIYTTPQGGDFSTAKYLGKIAYSSKMNEKTGSTDWAAIKLNPKAQRPNHSTKITMALDTYPRTQDKTVCKRGYTTGFDCGKKGEDNVRTQLRVTEPNQKEIIAVMSKAYLCALPGDSGSPIFDKEGIIGVLSSTSASQNDIDNHKCAANNVAFYSPITSVISEIEHSVPDIELQ